MTQLKYSEDELFTDHDYVRPQWIGDQRAHGGFDGDGAYQPPRAKVRVPALAAWADALRERGGELLDAQASELLRGVRYPTPQQSRFLLSRGHERSFWNTLTITGIIEGRGRLLADMTWPDLQEVVVEDISEMAIGHLGKGLLKTHGIDEGGEPEKGIGGHDVMWFALRDLAFGKRDWPNPEVPERIGRDASEEEVRLLPGSFHEMLSFLNNLLIIEFRAELGFASTQETLLDASLFRDRREEAVEAAEVVERIRTDELIHVESLRLYLGELRSVTLRTRDGKTRPGHEVIDPMWASLLRWATVDSPRLQAEQQREIYRKRLEAEPGGDPLFREFDALGEL